MQGVDVDDEECRATVSIWAQLEEWSWGGEITEEGGENLSRGGERSEKRKRNKGGSKVKKKGRKVDEMERGREE